MAIFSKNRSDMKKRKKSKPVIVQVQKQKFVPEVKYQGLIQKGDRHGFLLAKKEVLEEELREWFRNRNVGCASRKMKREVIASEHGTPASMFVTVHSKSLRKVKAELASLT